MDLQVLRIFYLIHIRNYNTTFQRCQAVFWKFLEIFYDKSVGKIINVYSRIFSVEKNSKFGIVGLFES